MMQENNQSSKVLCLLAFMNPAVDNSTGDKHYLNDYAKQKARLGGPDLSGKRTL
jgi:hypothetical protein